MTKTSARKPRVFWLHVHAFDEPRGRIWAVQTGGQYLIASEVEVRVPTMQTRFRGTGARQPRAFLRGVGVVRQRGGRIRITPA